MLKYILIVMAILFVTGCGCKPVVSVIPVKVHEPIPAPILRDDITIPKPPNRAIFIHASPIDRETILTKKMISLYKTIAKYRSKLKSIKEYDNNLTISTEKEYKKIYKDKKR